MARGLGLVEEFLVVARHNSLRQRVALGLENGSALNHNLPQAANMQALVGAAGSPAGPYLLRTRGRMTSGS